ncbi:hypothetical protein [Hymenobacter cellulosilyticus]|nr:hypothetical protein [Hymenobacter cellulosilyticus]
MLRFLSVLWLALLLTRPGLAQTQVLNATLDGYEYPFPVKYLP